ncbi:MAG TPA: peptide deformylase [Tepidisphaeraceae bacterium]|jgi:peptide deformylase|nr:peptide deformylase [Tepidisphaeraceae bacterium]
MYDHLTIIKYPDPRLKRIAKPVQQFDDDLRALVDRMFTLMRAAKGVGLAAPQVGVDLRLFVMNATGEPDGDRVYINPVLSEASGAEEDEEGCLSLPTIYIQVVRDVTLHMAAQDAEGKPFEEDATGFVARVWQHETDHLNGVMLTDRMGPVAKLTFRKKLKDMEQDYAELTKQTRK